MYRRAEFFKMDFPLKIEDIVKKFKSVKERTRKENDKNHITKKIDLKCTFEHKYEKNGTYHLGISIEYQIRANMAVPYQITSDLLAFIFFPKNNLLVVLGKNYVINKAIHEVSKILYPGEELRMFSPISFSVAYLINTIMQLRQDDPRSWCDEYRGRHDHIKYQNKKRKSNFSLEEGNCVLDDAEAKDAISKSSSISPKYKYYQCKKLSETSHDKPKTISFNGRDGIISLSIHHEFEEWYRFISFLRKDLKL